QTVSLSTAPDGAGREYPTFERLSTPIVQFSQQSAETIYWPWLVDKSAWGGTGYALFYSTDHAATHEPSGIFLLESDSITGPWVNRGKIWRDDTGGDQTETPSVIYDPVANRVLMFYQQGNIPGAVGAQQTCLATADPSDLTTWTRVGIVLDKEFAEQPGDGHCGYFRPFQFNGKWYGYSLYGGTNHSNASMWVSDDGGYTWNRDGRLIGWMQDKCGHLASVVDAEAQTVVLTMYEGDVINWKGRPWWVGVVGKVQSGSVLIRHLRLVTAPLADDFCSLAARVTDITPDPASYETQVDIDYPGNCISAGGSLYMVYRTGGQTGSFALMRLN
uniref:sialidase family protein n=1 Tax=Pluralibacter gergoviae TaxID=61647 RepID=UPI000A846481